MKEYGYVRVSTREQHPDRQIIALVEFGVPAENIFLDKMSGKDFERPAWKRMIEVLHPGDLLVVQSIDRIGREYGEVLSQWRFLVSERQVDLMVLDMPLLDTRINDDLTRRLISDMILQVMSYVAETERRLIRKRQKEGIAAARARGVRFGRQPLPIPDEFEELNDKVRRGELSRSRAAKRLGISAGTFQRMGERLAESKRKLNEQSEEGEKKLNER